MTRGDDTQEFKAHRIIELEPDGRHPGLEEQRRDLARSLCFLLESSHAALGETHFRLARLLPAVHGDASLGLQVGGHEGTVATFDDGRSLTVRLVSLRVYDPSGITAATAATPFSGRGSCRTTAIST